MSKKPALRPGLAVGEALRAIARHILAEARGVSQDPSRSDAQAVHDFRREMKRWRALLRLLGPFLGPDGRRLRDEARDLARALGGARDAQSALDALEDLASHGLAMSPRSLATVRGRMDDVRQTAEATTLTGDMRLRIARTLDEAAGAVERWRVDHLTFADASERLARGYAAAQHAIPLSWSDADAETLHELRKRVVNHRYQVEIVTPLWRRFGRLWLGEAQRLRERLGKHQDLLAIELLTAPHQPLAHWRTRLVPAIAARKAVHVATASRMASRLLLEKPKAFQRRLEVIWETASSETAPAEP
jgi:CHAD domain-containing protein